MVLIYPTKKSMVLVRRMNVSILEMKGLMRTKSAITDPNLTQRFNLAPMKERYDSRSVITTLTVKVIP